MAQKENKNIFQYQKYYVFNSAIMRPWQKWESLKASKHAKIAHLNSWEYALNQLIIQSYEHFSGGQTKLIIF